MSQLLLLFGVFCGSTAILWIKSSTLAPPFICAGRMLLGSLLLFPLFRRALRQHPEISLATSLRRALWPGFFMAVHMISWTMGARLATAAEATLIVNLAPIAMPFLLAFIAHERVTATEIMGTGLAVSGVVCLTWGDFQSGHSHLQGNLICFFSMLAASAYMSLGRRNRDIPSVWLYMVPLYAFAGVLCLAWGLVQQGWPQRITRADGIAVLCLALVPTICGHTILNYSMKKLSGQVVAIFNVFQFVFAGLLAAALLSEFPRPIFYLSSGLIVLGSLVALRGKPPLPRAEEFTD